MNLRKLFVSTGIKVALISIAMPIAALIIIIITETLLGGDIGLFFGFILAGIMVIGTIGVVFPRIFKEYMIYYWQNEDAKIMVKEIEKNEVDDIYAECQ